MAALTVDDETQVLPVGIHDATLDEIETAFGTWENTKVRPKLFEKLKLYVAAVKRTGLQCTIIANGSFVMRKIDDPDDIDAIIVVPAKVFDELEADTLPLYHFNIIDKGFCMREYRIDIKPCAADSEEYHNWEGFFTQVSMKRAAEHGLPHGSKKGLVRIIS